tara:strand:+ start:1142 stop:1879 length:738 start_codon:yes stop_codon:yes gene_type:complete
LGGDKVVTTTANIQTVSSIGNLILIQGTFDPVSGGFGSTVLISTEDGIDFSDFVSSIVSFNIDPYVETAENRSGGSRPGITGSFKLINANNTNNTFATGLTDTNGRMATGDTALEIIDAGEGYSAGSGVTLTGVLSGQTCNATITVSGGALATVKATSNGTGFTEHEPVTVAGGANGFVRANLSDAGTVSGFAGTKELNTRPSILIKNDNIIRIVDHMDSKIMGDHLLEGALFSSRYKFSLIGRR